MPIETFVHLALLALMLLLCLGAAIVARSRSEKWLPRHKLLGLAGACLGLAGVGVMISEKIEHGYPHFKSPHAIGGLLVGVLLVIVPLLGLLGSKGINILRKPHRIAARTLLAIAPIVMIAGVLRYLQLSAPRATSVPAPAPAAPPAKP